MLLGFCSVDVAGVPPVKFQDQEVGELVDKSVKLTVCPAVMLSTLAVKLATGAAPAAVTFM